MNKILTPGEEEVLQHAENMKNAGFSGGDNFNLEEDMKAMANAGMMSEEQIRNVTIASTEAVVPQQQLGGEPEMMEEEQSIPEDPEARLLYVAAELKKIDPNAPGEGRLRQWKVMHGEIFINSIGSQTFIFRYLKRQEWAQIKTQTNFENMTDIQIEDMYFDRCVMWPILNPVQKASLPAGAPTMIVQQIRMQSLFIEPEAAMQFTIKL